MTDVHELTPSDVVLMPAPLAHISGLLNGILVPASIGMTTVLLDRWSPSIALDLIERERVSFMVGPPTFFVDLMSDPAFSARRVESLRLVSSGGAGRGDLVRRAGLTRTRRGGEALVRLHRSPNRRYLRSPRTTRDWPCRSTVTPSAKPSS